MASFSVGIELPSFHDFQWRRNGADLSDGSGYAGVNSQTLLISPAAMSHAGEFDCVVTRQFNGCTVTSDTATLTVLPDVNDCPEDLDGDGDIDFDDLNALLAVYNTSDPDADFDGNGIVDFDDLNTLLAVYDTICP